MSALLVSLILAVIAALHLAWAFGQTWPAKSERDLAQRVAGFKGVDQMPPPAASAAVATLLLLGGFIALAAAGQVPSFGPDWLYTFAVWVMIVVFALRGLATYTSFWRKRTPVEPFATLDQRYYGPLCLLISGLLLGVVVY